MRAYKIAHTTMNADMEEYYAANKFFLSQIGGWPYQRQALRVLLPCLLTAVQYSVIATEVTISTNMQVYRRIGERSRDIVEILLKSRFISW